MAKDALEKGSAFSALLDMVKAQGGDISCLTDLSKLPKASVIAEVKAPCDGYITATDAAGYGRASLVLGAGRERKEDAIDHAAGIYVVKKTGEWVNEGDTLAILYTNKESSVAEAREIVLASTVFGDNKPVLAPIVHGVVL